MDESEPQRWILIVVLAGLLALLAGTMVVTYALTAFSTRRKFRETRLHDGRTLAEYLRDSGAELEAAAHRHRYDAEGPAIAQELRQARLSRVRLLLTPVVLIAGELMILASSIAACYTAVGLDDFMTGALITIAAWIAQVAFVAWMVWSSVRSRRRLEQDEREEMSSPPQRNLRAEATTPDSDASVS